MKTLFASLLVSVSCAAGAAAAPPSPCIDDRYDGIHFRGTLGKQKLVLTYAADGTATADIDCNGDGDFDDVGLGDRTAYPVNTLLGVYVELGGADSVQVNVPAWTDVHNRLSILLGPGTNSVVLNFGAATLTRSSLSAEITGGPGNDSVSLVSPPLLDASGLSLRAELGLGNDSFNLVLPAMANNAQLSVDVDLGAGTNGFALDQQHAVMNAGTAQVNVTGGAGVDQASVLLDGPWGDNSRFLFNADLGAANDKLAVFLRKNSGADFRVNALADVRLTASGGVGNDALSVVTDGTQAPFVDGRLDVSLAGGLGADTLTAKLTVDMFGGTTSLRADGGAGNDIVTVNLDSSPSAGIARHDLSVTGGSGNDVLTFNQTTAASSLFVGPSNLDGSFGTLDRCVVGGTNPPHKRNCEL